MTKTNFTKVEESFNEGLQKITVKRLIDEADRIKGKPKSETDEVVLRRQICITVLNAIKLYSKIDKRFFIRLGIDKQTIKRIFADPPNVLDKDWPTVLILKDKIRNYKKSKESLIENPNEKIIEDEILKHINKRHNINNKWLPLK